jgi:hypothetical protein
MRSLQRRSKAVTIVELIMAMAMLSVLMVVCAQLFTVSWRRFHIINVVQDVKMSGIRGMERFGRDFSETSMNYVNRETDSQGLTRWIYFPSQRTVDGSFTPDTGNLSTVWKTWIIYYLIPACAVKSDSQAKTFDNRDLYWLIRKVKAVPADVKSMTLNESLDINPELNTLKPVGLDASRGMTYGGEVCARNVTFFNVDTENTGALDTYRAVLETWGCYGGRKCSSKVEKIFLIQNI